MKFTLSPNMIHCLFQHKIKLSVIRLTYFPSLTPALQPWPPAKIIIKSYLKKPGCFVSLSFCSCCFLSLQCTSFSLSSVRYILNSSCKTAQMSFPLGGTFKSMCAQGRTDLRPPLSPLPTSSAASLNLHSI